MLGYAGIDTFFFANIETLIDDGLGAGNPQILVYAAIFVPAIFIIRGLFNFISTYFLSYVGFQIVTKMRQELFEHLMRLPVAYHDKVSTGDLISKITYDHSTVSRSNQPSGADPDKRGSVCDWLAWFDVLPQLAALTGLPCHWSSHW